MSAKVPEDIRRVPSSVNVPSSPAPPSPVISSTTRSQVKRLVIVADAGFGQENAIWCSDKKWHFKHEFVLPRFLLLHHKELAELEVDYASHVKNIDDLKLETIQIKEIILKW